MDMLTAVQLRALRNVYLDDAERDYHYRHIARWYSRQFHTPLHVVDELPLIGVLTAFFEEKYENMEEEYRHQEVLRLVEAPEERKARQAREQLGSDDQFLKDAFVVDTAKAEQARVKQLLVEGVSPKENLAATDAKELIAVVDEPDIKMSFSSSDDFEKELDGFGSMTQPD